MDAVRKMLKGKLLVTFVTSIVCVLTLGIGTAYAAEEELPADIADAVASAAGGSAAAVSENDAATKVATADDSSASGSEKARSAVGADTGVQSETADTEGKAASAGAESVTAVAEGKAASACAESVTAEVEEQPVTPTDSNETSAVAIQASGSEQTEQAVPSDPGFAEVEYVISVRDNENEILDIMGDSKKAGGNLALYKKNYDWWQKFKPVTVSEGFYKIVAQHSQMVLTARGLDLGSNVVQDKWTGSDLQIWSFWSVDGYWYRIMNKASGLYLDVEGGHAGDSVNVKTWDENASNNGLGQQFHMQYVPYRTVADGTYAIQSASNSDQVLDVVASSKRDGANVTSYCNTNSSNQKFVVTYEKNGYYTIRNLNSGKVLDVTAGLQELGTNVSQFGYWGGDNQLWEFQ